MKKERGRERVTNRRGRGLKTFDIGREKIERRGRRTKTQEYKVEVYKFKTEEERNEKANGKLL